MCVCVYANIQSRCKYTHTQTHTHTRTEVRSGILYSFLLLSDKKLPLATRGTTTSSKGQKRGNKPYGGGKEGGREGKKGETRKEGSEEGVGIEQIGQEEMPEKE